MAGLIIKTPGRKQVQKETGPGNRKSPGKTYPDRWFVWTSLAKGVGKKLEIFLVGETFGITRPYPENGGEISKRVFC